MDFLAQSAWVSLRSTHPTTCRFLSARDPCRQIGHRAENRPHVQIAGLPLVEVAGEHDNNRHLLPLGHLDFNLGVSYDSALRGAMDSQSRTCRK